LNVIISARTSTGPKHLMMKKQRIVRNLKGGLPEEKLLSEKGTAVNRREVGAATTKVKGKKS